MEGNLCKWNGEWVAIGRETPFNRRDGREEKGNPERSATKKKKKKKICLRYARQNRAMHVKTRTATLSRV